MRTPHERLVLFAFATWLGAIGLARADITTERSASILVFPKIIADGTRDTIIHAR